MKKLRVILGFVIVMMFAAAAFSGAQDFVLVNNTGRDIYVVNVSPTTTNDWEEDILGSDVLENGDTVTVRFGVGSTRYWDIQAVFKDGTSIAWDAVDLLETSVVTLNGDGTASLE